MRRESCSDCYWQDQGFCKVNPPSATLAMHQGLGGATPQPISFHPPVRPDNFCSQFRHAKLAFAQVIEG